MIISHKKRFVMFLPWKTASQTIALRLQPYNESPYDRFFYFNRHLNRVVHQHISCADFVCLPESKFGYFAASFVRNPYDRAFSGFRQLQKDIQEQPNAKYPETWIRDLVNKQLAENLAKLREANFQFDEWLALIDESQVYEVGRNSNFPLHPSHYWTHIAGQQFVEFIGRVENFEAYFNAFCSRAGIASTEAVNYNIFDLQGSSANNSSGYRYVDRMNAASIDKINVLFSEDFKLFGYETIAP
jgi:hypothetical protein